MPVSHAVNCTWFSGALAELWSNAFLFCDQCHMPNLLRGNFFVFPTKFLVLFASHSFIIYCKNRWNTRSSLKLNFGKKNEDGIVLFNTRQSLKFRDDIRNRSHSLPQKRRTAFGIQKAFLCVEGSCWIIKFLFVSFLCVQSTNIMQSVVAQEYTNFLLCQGYFLFLTTQQDWIQKDFRLFSKERKK